MSNKEKIAALEEYFFRNMKQLKDLLELRLRGLPKHDER
jgi:hypothetical protein